MFTDIRVVEQFFKSGIPMKKIDNLRSQKHVHKKEEKHRKKIYK